MILALAHTQLDVYKAARILVLLSYKITAGFPSHERYGITSQIRRASLSVLLNIAEGPSRISQNEKRRFYVIARSSLVETDAAIDIAIGLGYTDLNSTSELNKTILRCFQMLSAMIKL